MNANLDETRLLSEINANLPPGVDWQKGAMTYISNFVAKKGTHARWFHYSMPFGDNFENCQQSFYDFLNILQLIRPSSGIRFLDVGCGPGWVSHFLAKFDLALIPTLGN
jgi:SAM-dependent methyltransferase